MINKVIRGIALPLALMAVTSFGMVTGALAQMSETSTGNSSTATGSLSTADRHFIKEAAQGGMAEVQLGQMAVEKASSPDVKQFGQRMVDDHSKANDQLKQVASEKGVTVPDKLSAKDAATKAKLEKLSGEAFDRAYMKDMVTDHTKDVSAFRTASKTAKDPAVKNFASETLPTLEDHLKEAKSIAPKVAKSSASGGAQ
jgi:putative membrane protein